MANDPHPPIPLYQVDAFADRAFAGNPAAVCLLPEARDDDWMRAVAREMNLSETAFLLPLAEGYSLRWFTPAVEVDLCGHATLASAHVLWETGLLAPEETARFHTRSGLLTAAREGNAIRLNFPAIEASPADAPPGLLQALGADALSVHRCGDKYLLHLENETAVRKLAPDFAALRKLPLRGVMATAAADAGSACDFVSRYFAPWVGIDEDPVTGSAHCCLGPYWSRQTGKREFTAFQASARGGQMRVRLVEEKVELMGKAVTVVRGSLLG